VDFAQGACSAVTDAHQAPSTALVTSCSRHTLQLAFAQLLASLSFCTHCTEAEQPPYYQHKLLYKRDKTLRWLCCSRLLHALVDPIFRQSVKVTFKTDLGQAMTCGAARKGHGYDSPRKSRDGYGSYSDVDDQRHDDDEEDSEYESRRSDYGVRQLLQAQSAHKPRGSK
jgi:hypothetical protein